MKRPLLAHLAFIVCTVGATPRLTADDGSITEIATVSGRSYRACTILGKSLDGVTFRHARGTASLPFTDLTPKTRESLGYDPAKAKAAREAKQQAQTKAREAQQQAAEQRREAFTAAYRSALEQQLLVELQQALYQLKTSANSGLGLYNYPGALFPGSSLCATTPCVPHQHAGQRSSLGPSIGQILGNVQCRAPGISPTPAILGRAIQSSGH